MWIGGYWRLECGIMCRRWNIGGGDDVDELGTGSEPLGVGFLSVVVWATVCWRSFMEEKCCLVLSGKVRLTAKWVAGCISHWLVIDWPWSWPVIRNSLVMTAQQWVHCLVILFSFTSILPPLYSSFLMNLCHVARCRQSWCQTRRRRHCCLRMPRAWVVATSLLDTLATISMSILANSPIEKKKILVLEAWEKFCMIHWTPYMKIHKLMILFILCFKYTCVVSSTSYNNIKKIPSENNDWLHWQQPHGHTHRLALQATTTK